jgi:predicted ATP-dependent Lon-type protease
MITITAKIYLPSGDQIEINRNNMISCEGSIFDRSDLKLPSFGIISNTGNIRFNDSNGQVLVLAEDLQLNSGLMCEIYLNNTLVEGATELIGVYETDQWDYDNDSKEVSVSLKDDLEEWQDIAVSEISYDPRNPTAKPFSWLYDHLWDIVKQNYDMREFGDLDDSTRNVLENTYIQYPMLKAGSLWQQWTKLCQVCQLHIYKNSDGVIVCRYNGGN